MDGERTAPEELTVNPTAGRTDVEDRCGGGEATGWSPLARGDGKTSSSIAESAAAGSPLAEGSSPEIEGFGEASLDRHLCRVSRLYCQRLERAMDEFVERVSEGPLEDVLFYRQEHQEVQDAAVMKEREDLSNHLLNRLRERDVVIAESMGTFMARLGDTKRELQEILRELHEKEVLRGGTSHRPADRQEEALSAEQTDKTGAVRSKRRLLDTMYSMSETWNTGLMQMTQITLGDSKDPCMALKLCPLDCSVLGHALITRGSVGELNLSHCSIEPEGIRQLCPVLHLCKTLRLGWNNLGDPGVKALCLALREPACKIQELWLDHNGLTDAGSRELASALGKNQSLKLLSLSYNKVGDGTVRALCEALKGGGRTLQHLRLCGTGFTNAHCRQLARDLVASRSLTGLHLDDNQLGDSAVNQLCGALKKPECRIQTLGLAGNRLTSLCTRELTHVLNANRSLRQLNLSYNRLGLSGVRRLSVALGRSTCRIQRLELDENSLRDSSVEELASALVANRSLRGLYLSRNAFTDKSIPAFQRLAASCARLRYIWLWRNLFSPEGKTRLQSLNGQTGQPTMFL